MSDFQDDLAFADSQESLVRLSYECAFPGATFIAKNSGDNIAQREGVDHALYLPGGTTILIDDKIRRIACPGDLLLEHTSNVQTGAPGWIHKPHPLDYLHTLYVPTRTGIMAGWPMLKKAWAIHGQRWVKQYRSIPGSTQLRNGCGYQTLSVAVPLMILIEVGVNISKYVIPYPKTAPGSLPPLPSPPKSRQGDLFR